MAAPGKRTADATGWLIGYARVSTEEQAIVRATWHESRQPGNAHEVTTQDVREELPIVDAVIHASRRPHLPEKNVVGALKR